MPSDFLKKYFVVLLYVFSFMMNAQTWNQVGSSRAIYANRLVVHNNNLFATKSGVDKYGNQGDRLYYFNGSKWDTLSAIIQGLPSSYLSLNSNLYVAGSFVRMGDNLTTPYPDIQKIAKWNGNTWESVGNNISSSTTSNIYALAEYKGEVYAGGTFGYMGGIPVNKIARWDGTQWKDVGGGVIGGLTYINAMAVYKGELYVGGSFTATGNCPAYNIAKWNGTIWKALPNTGTNGDVSSMVVDTVKKLLYIGGGFTSAGGVQVNAVASFDSTQWIAPGQGITNGAMTMCMFNNELYVGTLGPHPQTTNDTLIAKWDGTSWSAVLGPSWGSVHALTEYNGNLYAGGNFTMVNGDTAVNKLACYGNTCPQGVGINKLGKSSLQFSIYPNPAGKEITIKVEDTIDTKKYAISIVNNLGQEVYRGVMKGEIKINTQNYTKGLFTAKLCDSNNNCSTQKIIIE